MSQASNVLSNHPHDNANSRRERQKKNNETMPNGEKEDEEQMPLSFAQIEGKCYCCGKPGHKSPNCRQKDKPKEEWWINKAQQHLQKTQQNTSTSTSTNANTESPNNTNDTSNPTPNEQPSAWMGVHLSQTAHVQLLERHPMSNMQEWILLDSQSSTSIFCNPKYVTNIRSISANEPSLQVQTNGGTFQVRKKATVDNFGTVWYDPQSITNIFSHAEMADKYRITYDNHDMQQGDAFEVHMPLKTIRFKRLTNNLYVYKPNKSPTTKATTMVNTVKENRNFYTERQFERAKRARDLYHAVGTPSINDFKAILRMNTISDNPVTTKDIVLAEKIFGPDIGSLKGKSTRNPPIPVVDDMIEIPRALIQSQQNVTLCIDAMKVNGLVFLTTISRNIYYRTAQFIPRQTIDQYKIALTSVIQCYNKGGFRIGHIHADNEFRPLLAPLEDEFRIHINFANPQDHVPEAERNNRTIKERVRATYHRLPYHTMTRTMVKIIVQEAAKKLNFFPARHGISEFYSPRMILHQRNLNYSKHCKYSFGSFVEASNEPNPTNTTAPHTLDCIYLCYNDADQGGHECLHLPTNRIITRSKVTLIPITTGVINQIRTIATQEGMPEGLKIINKYDIVLYDSAWIAGVDYEANEEESDSDDETYIESEQDEDNETNDDDEDNDFDDDSDDDDDYQDPDEDEQQQQVYDEMEQEYDEIESNEEEDYQDRNDEEDENGNNGGTTTTPAPEPESEPVQTNPTIETETETNNNQQQETAVIEDEAIENETNDGGNENETNDVQQQQPNQSNKHVTRSGRVSRPPTRFNEYHMHLQTQAHPKERMIEYDKEEAKVFATIMQYHGMLQTNITHLQHKMRNKVKWKNNKRKKKQVQLAQTYSLKAALKKFKEKGKDATMDEMKQLDDRNVYYPIKVGDLTQKERKRAMESLLFIVEKQDGRVKAHFCANGSTQREYMDRDATTSPTVMTESIFITSVIDAKQNRDVMTCDIPNAFVQTEIEEAIVGERIIMKIRGALVQILVEMDYEKYGKFVCIENGQEVLYVVMSRALYGMIQSSILYYRKFRKDIETIGFKVNPYDPCVANRIVKGSQQTVCWHVDDLKSSHKLKEVNDEFLKWLNEKYGDIVEVKATRGKKHDYLAMIIKYEDGKVMIDMCYYVQKMIDEFPEKLKKGVKCPWTERLFKVDENSPKLDEKHKQTFHTFVIKGMFLSKRSRQDIQLCIVFLATRVRDPTEQDWQKLVRLMSFLEQTKDDLLTLEANEEQSNEYWIDAAFAVHPDYRSHTGAIQTLGKGAISSISTKQKVNSRSSTEAELIGIDDVILKVLWSKRFIEAQGFNLKATIVYRDNTSSMKLEENGRASASKRTRHFNIKYFYVTDLIQRKEFELKYCPTEEMMADYFTKPLTGQKFDEMRAFILNLPTNPM